MPNSAEVKLGLATYAPNLSSDNINRRSRGSLMKGRCEKTAPCGAARLSVAEQPCYQMDAGLLVPTC